MRRPGCAHRHDELRRFGAVRSLSGASLALGFTRQLSDPSTGFLDLHARRLDPALDRFLSADTVQPSAPGVQGYNLSAYVANNPTTRVDPSETSITAGAIRTESKQRAPGVPVGDLDADRWPEAARHGEDAQSTGRPSRHKDTPAQEIPSG